MRSRIAEIAAWVEDRTGLGTGISRILVADIPASAGWAQVFGSVLLFLFLIQALTGILLALNYAPTTGDAYTSLIYIVRQVSGGRIIRGLHHWGASLMIIVVFLHMAQVFAAGAYKRPREVTWLTGIGLLLLTLGFCLTGQLLSWDNRAYWGATVTTKLFTGLPVLGPVLGQLADATNGVGSITFSRFYTLHVLLIPTGTLALIAMHIYLVRRHGITPTKMLQETTQKFYPRQIFRDSCSVFVAFVCLFVAARFYEVPLERMADPTDTTYVPRPDWYFLFLFQLLKLFPGRLEVIATFILPLSAISILVLLPFLRRTQATILKTRLHAVSVIALSFSIWLALTTAAGWSAPHPGEIPATSPEGYEWNRIRPEQIAGFGHFRSRGCESCHNIVVGNPKAGPTLGLTGIQHPRDWILEHFRDEAAEGPPTAGLAPLSLPQQNAVVLFVASVKPDLLPILSAVPADIVSGAQTYVANACASCHRVNGIGGDIGPSLNGLINRRSEVWVHSHFAAPRQSSPGSVMPIYHLDKRDEQNLIRYLFSLRE